MKLQLWTTANGEAEELLGEVDVGDEDWENATACSGDAYELIQKRAYARLRGWPLWHQLGCVTERPTLPTFTPCADCPGRHSNMCCQQPVWSNDG